MVKQFKYLIMVDYSNVDTTSFKFSINHWAKRLSQKIAIRNFKSINKDKFIVISDYESEAIKICRNIVKNVDTELSMSPSGERFATNDKLNLEIIIYEKSVDVIKNMTPKNIPISPKAHRTILNMFDGHVQMRRDFKKEKIYVNLKNTLESILDETKNALETQK